MYGKIILILQKIDYILFYVRTQEAREQINNKELYEWLSKEEVIEYLRISPSTYYEWIKRGYLVPSSMIGEDRFLVEHINQFVARRGNRERTDFGATNKANNS